MAPRPLPVRPVKKSPIRPLASRGQPTPQTPQEKAFTALKSEIDTRYATTFALQRQINTFQASLSRLQKQHTQTLTTHRQLEDAYFSCQARILDLDANEPDGRRRGGIGALAVWEADLDDAETEFQLVGGELRGVEHELRSLERKIGRGENRVMEVQVKKIKVDGQIRELESCEAGADA
jgi:hypothetical protein